MHKGKLIKKRLIELHAIKRISFELLLIIELLKIITTAPLFSAIVIGVDIYSDAAAASAVGVTIGTVCKRCFADCSCASIYAL